MPSVATPPPPTPAENNSKTTTRNVIFHPSKITNFLQLLKGTVFNLQMDKSALLSRSVKRNAAFLYIAVNFFR